MSPGFRETKCGCHECESVERLREIIDEQKQIIDGLRLSIERWEAERKVLNAKLGWVQLYCGDCGKTAGVARKLSPALCAECLSKQFAP